MDMGKPHRCMKCYKRPRHLLLRDIPVKRAIRVCSYCRCAVCADCSYKHVSTPDDIMCQDCVRICNWHWHEYCRDEYRRSPSRDATTGPRPAPPDVDLHPLQTPRLAPTIIGSPPFLVPDDIGVGRGGSRPSRRLRSRTRSPPTRVH